MISNQDNTNKRMSRPSSKPTTPMFSHQTFSNNLNSIISASPLKVPLQLAVSKLVQNMQVSPKNSRLSRKSSISTRISNHIDINDQNILKQIHPEVFEFLKKYFGGRNTSTISIQEFIESIIEQFIGQSTNMNDKLDLFVNRLIQLLGQQFLVLSKLEKMTRDKGLTGMIVDILKQVQNHTQCQQISTISYMYNQNSELQMLQSPQLSNLKNVLTQFFQSMAKSIENQLYSKFNKQMRKLVLKYNETQKILKEINQTINQNIHNIKNNQNKKQKSNVSNNILEEYNKKISNLEEQSQKQKIRSNLTMSENIKLRQENKKLNAIIYQLKLDISQYTSIPLQGKQKLMSTQSTNKTDKREIDNQSVVVSNFGAPSMTSMITRVVPLSPLKRPNSSTGQNNSNNNLKLIRTDRQLTPGINLISKSSTPKNKMESKVNPLKLVYFA